MISATTPQVAARPSDGGAAAGPGHLKKAQPQVPTSNRYHSASPAKELPPYEAPPVYENIQDVHSSEMHKAKTARPQVPSSSAYYNSANINGGDYVVMTGKLANPQGQKGSYAAAGPKLDRRQNYDNLFQRSCDQMLGGKYLSSCSLEQQNSKSTYVPPSELQQTNSYVYEQPQQAHYPARANLSYHGEASPSILNYSGQAQYQHYRNASADGTKSAQHNYYRSEIAAAAAAATTATSLSTSYFNNDAHSRQELPVYSCTRTTEAVKRYVSTL